MSTSGGSEELGSARLTPEQGHLLEELARQGSLERAVAGHPPPASRVLGGGSGKRIGNSPSSHLPVRRTPTLPTSSDGGGSAGRDHAKLRCIRPWASTSGPLFMLGTRKRPWLAEANQGRSMLPQHGGGGTRTPKGLRPPHFECGALPVRLRLQNLHTVGTAGFEPATPRSRSECSTGLSHVPKIPTALRPPSGPGGIRTHEGYSPHTISNRAP